jgi:glyoxylate/hydroxypyruvate reductase A
MEGKGGDVTAAREIILVKSGGKAAISQWRRAFTELAADLDVRWWDDTSVDPDAVRYVLVWQPESGRIARYRNLRVIFSSGAGVDHITCDPHLPRHLPIVRMASDETIQTVCEYVCLGVLAIQRDLRRMIAAQAACLWEEFEPPRTACDTRVGIMGLGNIGASTARMLRGLGYQVAGWARSEKSLDGVRCFSGTTELEAFLSWTDILVGLLPDTAETRGLVDARRIAMLPRGAGVLNAGRGTLVVMPDLIAALDSGHLSSAFLDVFEPEPLPPDHPAWRHPRITVTSHVAAFASRAARARHVLVALAAYRRGDELPHRYQPERGY